MKSSRLKKDEKIEDNIINIFRLKNEIDGTTI